MIIAEDGEGKQHLVGADRERRGVLLRPQRRSAQTREFTGPTFSHDRRTLFANVQSPGYVYAIHGPFRKQHC